MRERNTTSKVKGSLLKLERMSALGSFLTGRMAANPRAALDGIIPLRFGLVAGMASFVASVHAGITDP